MREETSVLSSTGLVSFDIQFIIILTLVVLFQMFLSTPTTAHSGLIKGIMKSKMFENALFSFNQVDLQNMMDPNEIKRSHQSKFVKQFCYYTILFILQIRRVKILISIVKLSQSA